MGSNRIKDKIKKNSPIRTPMLTQGRLERMETNLMHFEWEETWTHEIQPNII